MSKTKDVKSYSRPQTPEQYSTIPASQIKEKFVKTVHDSDNILNNSEDLKSSILEIAVIVEELSANTEETASAAIEINSNAENVSNVVNDVAVNLINNI